MTIFTSYIAFLSYLAGIIIMQRAATSHSAGAAQQITRVAFIACSFHALSLILAFWQHQGLSNSFYDAFSLTALIVVVTAIITQRQQVSRIIAVPIFTIAGLCVMLAANLGEHHPLNTLSKGITAHIISSIIAYGLLCVCALYAVVLWITDQQLRKHSLTSNSMPPLQQTEQTLFYTLHLGWAALSCALITGLVYVDDFIGQHLSHKMVFSILSWLVFGILVVGHWLWGWRGKQAAVWTIGGFSFLALAYLGSKFVLDVLLDKL